MGRAELRVAVGSPNGRRSTVWKIWAAKSDVYIQSRMMGANMKVSLHQSGSCQFSATSEWLVRHAPPGTKNAERHIRRWKLPHIGKAGAAPVFRIMVPSSELRRVPFAEELEGIQWLPDPGPALLTAIDC